MSVREAAAAALVMVAFAANSLLCRAALGGETIDPLSFTSIRLSSGALALLLLARFGEGRSAGSAGAPRSEGSWGSALALFGYAAAFSLAYVTLETGTGALVLFGAVQLTMIGHGLAVGERLTAARWGGVLAACGGLVYLLLPGLSAPDPLGAALMGVAGVSWGVYSVRGRGALAPIRMTAGNFARATPIAIGASVVTLSSAHATPAGLGLAVTSGVVTSGLGYALWYRVLRRLTSTTAAVIQLTVPAIAAAAGVLFLEERPTVRLLVASALILSGVAAVVSRPRER